MLAVSRPRSTPTAAAAGSPFRRRGFRPKRQNSGGHRRHGSGWLYAVGLTGTVYHRDARRWRKPRLPDQSAALQRAVSPPRKSTSAGTKARFIGAIVGAGSSLGIPLRPDVLGHGIIPEKGLLGLPGGIQVYDGEELKDVDLGVKRAVSCHRLHAYDGVLWSFGVDDLFVFDGKKWREIICPENEP